MMKTREKNYQEKNKKKSVDKNSLQYMSKSNTGYIISKYFLSYNNLKAVMEVKFEDETVKKLCTFV